MSRRPYKFRQVELTRVFRAIKAAGFAVGRVDIDVAAVRISILSQAPTEAATTDSAATPLDEWMAKRAHSS